MKTFLTIVVGVLLIAVITPLAQFMTLSISQTDMETATPAGWVFGLVFSLVLVAATIRALSRYQVVSRQSLVIIFSMLSVAVPLMNLGLVRPMFLAVRSVQQHFLNHAVNTYRTAYRYEDGTWYPLVPTVDGLAWNKADRLLRLLRDDGAVKKREAARRDLMSALAIESRKIREGGTNRTEQADKAKALVEKLGVDEADSLKESLAGDRDLGEAAAVMGVTALLESRIGILHAGSAEAATRLNEALKDVDEFDLYYVDAIRKRFDRSTNRRADADFDRLAARDGSAAEAVKKRAAGVGNRLAALQADLSVLSNADLGRVRAARAEYYKKSFATLSEDALAEVRTSFIYRSTSRERRAVMGQDGRDGEPNGNLMGLEKSLWSDATQMTQVEGLSIWGKAALAPPSIPWTIWVVPMVMWFLLFLCLFMFLMCLAEWLRRKWVDRENLAFPLVEIADNMIRHDYALERAEDVREPERRKGSFHALFWVGFAVAVLIVGVEVLGHYRIMNAVKVVGYNISSNMLTSGDLKQLDKIVFILSPVVVGLLYLVSLEVSFSIWAIFLIFKLSFWLIQLGKQDIKDGVFTGYGGGRNYPFSMEQLLGAAVCCTLILLYKAWASSREARGRDVLMSDAYVPQKLNRIGLVVFPLVSMLLLWSLGITNLPFLLLMFAVVMALTIAGARLRAETGLPAQHFTYEFGKLPMVLGLTGFTGAKVYTAFVTFTFLPFTLLFRTLPQQLENIELARRNKVRFRTVAIASLVGFLAAVVVGMLSFLVLSYAEGEKMLGVGTSLGISSDGAVCYPLWNSHFLGEGGLDKFITAHPIRVWFMGIGFAIFGVLVWLRGRFMNFPLHPLGYLLLLFSTQFDKVSPYHKGVPGTLDLVDTSWIWGGALVAWGIKKLVVKYGGMNAYKQSKPIFIGLVVGAVMTLFVVNAVDLAASLKASRPGVKPGTFLKTFMESPPYTPRVY